MMHSPKDSTRRFSNRVANYVRYRPNYPVEVLAILQEKTGLRSISVVADIGSGTGISARLLLQNGNSVFGVEPNVDMRQSAEAQLKAYPRFHSIAGTAESTQLQARSVDYVLAAQAFHWFNWVEAKREFTRILKPGGWTLLIWNSRRTNSSPFLRGYEALLQRYGTDYREICHKNIDRAVLQDFFAPGQFEFHSCDNEQWFDFTGLKGRLLSSSYTPDETHPNFQPMLTALEHLFSQYEENGVIRFEYDTELYFGSMI